MLRIANRLPNAAWGVMTMTTLQEYADEIVAPEYRQPLKTIREACEMVGWEFHDKPTCCGQYVTVRSFINAYHAECKSCGRFIRDMSGPMFGNSWVQFLDESKVDLNTDKSWITGICPVEQRIGADQ